MRGVAGAGSDPGQFGWPPAEAARKEVLLDAFKTAEGSGPRWLQLLDRSRSTRKLAASLLGDGVFDGEDAKELVRDAKDFGKITDGERKVFASLLREHADQLTPEAREALATYFALPLGRPQVIPVGGALVGPEEPRATHNEYTTAELLELFRSGTKAEADPRWLVNAKPRYRVEGDELVVTREDWELTWPKDLQTLTRYGAADRLGMAIEKHFDSAQSGITYAVRGARSGIGQTDNLLERVTYSGPASGGRSLEAVALRYPPQSLSAGYTDYFRFLPPERPGEGPTRLIGTIHKDGGIEAAFIMEKRTREVRVPLREAKLDGLSTDDIKRMWNDPAITYAPEPEAHAGTWKGHILLDDVTAPDIMSFKHESWKDDRLGMVGTFHWPMLFQHGGMLIRKGQDGTRLDFFPKGFQEDLRAVRGNPNIMLGRFAFLLRDKDGNENTRASLLSRALTGAMAAGVEKLSPGHWTRTDAEGNTYLEGYYVIAKQVDDVSGAEKKRFERDRTALTREYERP